MEPLGAIALGWLGALIFYFEFRIVFLTLSFESHGNLVVIFLMAAIKNG